MRTVALCIMLASCGDVMVEPECEVARVDIRLPEGAYEDEEACPQIVLAKPWEFWCGRAYMTEQQQVDGRWEWVCTRARDCDCLEAWAECSGDDVPVPGYCAYY